MHFFDASQQLESAGASQAATPTRLNRASGCRPLYKQLADVIRDQILAGVFPAGAVLPGEFALAQRYEVGRETARQAMAILRAEAWCPRPAKVAGSDARSDARQFGSARASELWHACRPIASAKRWPWTKVSRSSNSIP